MIEINKLVRSKRRTLSLIVETDGTLTVRAPLRMKKADIRHFIEEKAGWIKRKQARTREDALPARQYVDGEMFLYLGKEYPLRLVPDPRPALVLEEVFKLTKSAQPQAESVFEAWYKKQARMALTERISFFARSHNFKPGKLRISSARTRWGSCSAKGSLSFTWRLMMAPPEAIDYVVLHELCHLKEMNHSKAFWAQVRAIMPDYQAKRKWLKENGRALRL